jgi:hypothetical protein
MELPFGFSSCGRRFTPSRPEIEGKSYDRAVLPAADDF